MARFTSANLVRDFRALFGSGTLAGSGDGLLLERFITRRDEVAFEELMARHGPVVLSICRRWLDDPRDVEDAFQATFLILVRKAASLRDRDALSSWLYGVALRVVRRARSNAMRRRTREQPISAEPVGCGRDPEECTGSELSAIVDEEIRRLPEPQQIAVILCLLEGYTHEAAAKELGWPLGTVKSRIAAARQTLTRRLSRRGLAPSGMVAFLKSAPVLGEPSRSIAPHLMRRTLDTARESLAQSSIPTAGMPATVASLVREGAENDARDTHSIRDPGRAGDRYSGLGRPGAVESATGRTGGAHRVQAQGRGSPIAAAADRSLRRSLAARGRDAPGDRPLPPGPHAQAHRLFAGWPARRDRQRAVSPRGPGRARREPAASARPGNRKHQRFRRLARWDDDRRRGIPARARAERRGESTDLRRRGHRPGGRPGRLGRSAERRAGRLCSRWQDRRDR